MSLGEQRSLRSLPMTNDSRRTPLGQTYLRRAHASTAQEIRAADRLTLLLDPRKNHN